MSACQTETETAGIKTKGLLTTLSPWREEEGEQQLLVESVEQKEKAASNISEPTVNTAEPCSLRGGTVI